VPFAAGATLLSGTLAIGGLATSVANADGILITGASTFQ
jgi:Na+(H+)/acetate symporter ActP